MLWGWAMLVRCLVFALLVIAFSVYYLHKNHWIDLRIDWMFLNCLNVLMFHTCEYDFYYKADLLQRFFCGRIMRRFRCFGDFIFWQIVLKSFVLWNRNGIDVDQCVESKKIRNVNNFVCTGSHWSCDKHNYECSQQWNSTGKVQLMPSQATWGTVSGFVFVAGYCVWSIYTWWTTRNCTSRSNHLLHLWQQSVLKVPLSHTFIHLLWKPQMLTLCCEY